MLSTYRTVTDIRRVSFCKLQSNRKKIKSMCADCKELFLRHSALTDADQTRTKGRSDIILIKMCRLVCYNRLFP